MTGPFHHHQAFPPPGGGGGGGAVAVGDVQGSPLLHFLPPPPASFAPPAMLFPVDHGALPPAGPFSLSGSLFHQF